MYLTLFECSWRVSVAMHNMMTILFDWTTSQFLTFFVILELCNDMVNKSPNILSAVCCWNCQESFCHLIKLDTMILCHSRYFSGCFFQRWCSDKIKSGLITFSHLISLRQPHTFLCSLNTSQEFVIQVVTLHVCYSHCSLVSFNFWLNQLGSR